MKFSIIIPVRKINEFLKENISHLKELDYFDFEVIIITDNPETYDFGGDSRFKIISSVTPGPGEKRNLGAKESTGDVLAFLDDDAFPSENWLTEANNIFEDSSVFAVGGPAMTPKSAGFLERMSGLILESPLSGGGTIYRHIPSKRREINDYPSVNLLIRKTAFNEVGGFPVEFWPGEDTKICLDLVKKNGKNFLYDPSIIVFHHRRNLLIPHLKQLSRYGRHRGQFARIFPESSRIPSYFVPSAFTLGLVIGPLVCYFFPFLWNFYFGVLLMYFGLLFAESLRAFTKEKNVKTIPYFIIGMFFTHIVYGVNFIIGLIKRPELKFRGVDKVSGNYLGG